MCDTNSTVHENAFVPLESPLSDFGKRDSMPSPSISVTVKLTAVATDKSEFTSAGITIGHWDAGLLDCTDSLVPNCSMVFLCPGISAAQIASRVGIKCSTAVIVFVFPYVGLYATAIVFAMAINDVYTSYIGAQMTDWGYVNNVMNIYFFFLTWWLRVRVRDRFHLPGHVMEDLLISALGPHCSLAQMATHVKSYTSGSCTFRAPDELPAYDA